MLLAKADTPAKRAIFSRAVAILEKKERELTVGVRTAPTEETVVDRARAARAKAVALIRKIDERIAAEEAASPAGQKRRHEAELVAAYTAHAKTHVDPPKQT